MVAEAGKPTRLGVPNQPAISSTFTQPPNREDWVELDFGKRVAFSRVVLHPYGERGKIQPPASYDLQVFADGEWRSIPD
jgi:hypothetical protein